MTTYSTLEEGPVERRELAVVVAAREECVSAQVPMSWNVVVSCCAVSRGAVDWEVVV